jgi:hypothetical protein
MTLKDGSEPLDPRLDRLYEEDWNSLNYPVTALLEEDRPYENYEPESMIWLINTTLDQGKEGACVGFAYTHDILARPNTIRAWNGQPVDAKFAREQVYWEAQKIDQWDGGSYPGAQPVYEGSSILAGAKVLTTLGFYNGYYWALDLKQLALGVSYIGPAVLGLKWYRGMSSPDMTGFIYPTGPVAGGHAILCHGVEIYFLTGSELRSWENVDKQRSHFRLHNSWGSDWGKEGDCYLTFNDMEKLLNEQGEACIPSRV